MPTPTRSFEVIQLLVRHRVRFIIVGMTAGVLQGAPAVTFDLDILYDRSEPNVTRLMAALEELEAVFRLDARRLRPNESHLRSAGHKLLTTKWGVVDMLGSLDDRPFDQVAERSIILDVEGMQVSVLSLAELIEVKARAGRDKDLAVLPLLRATLARRGGSDS
jgi:Aminoglycoside-2''-adenylyltransferase